jgi:DNA-binding LacI/PurR family transcriptional regulator
VDGLIMMSSDIDDPILPLLIRDDSPLVLVGRHPYLADVSSADVDNRDGAVQAVRHLIELGHRRIAHLAGPLDWYDAREREQGWRESLAAAGLDAGEAIIGDWTSDYGYEVGKAFDPGSATAVFAANDQMALGLVHGLVDQGLRVPEDVSVVGFDDVPDARHFLPPLTTVRQDFSALGELALELVIAAIDGEDHTRHDRIAPLLVVRSSTAPAPRD